MAPLLRSGKKEKRKKKKTLIELLSIQFLCTFGFMFGLSGHSCLFDVNVTIINCAICIYLCIIEIHRNHCLVFYTDTHKSYDVNIFIQFYNQYALKNIYIYIYIYESVSDLNFFI